MRWEKLRSLRIEREGQRDTLEFSNPFRVSTTPMVVSYPFLELNTIKSNIYVDRQMIVTER